jgi:hypothetical protein
MSRCPVLVVGDNVLDAPSACRHLEAHRVLKSPYFLEESSKARREVWI